MKKSKITLGTMVAASLLLCSCATMINGTDTPIYLHGSSEHPVGMVSRRHDYGQQRLPATLRVKHRQLKDTIRVTADSLLLGTIVPGRQLNAGWMVADLMFNPFALPVDFATGAIYSPLHRDFLLDDNGQLHPTAAGSALRQPQHPAPTLRHELSIELGLGTRMGEHYAHRIYDRARQLMGDDMGYQCGLGIYGATLDVGYYYSLGRRLAVGAMGGYTACGEDYEQWEPGGFLPDAVFGGTVRRRAVYVMPSAKYTWYENSLIGFYSRAAVGLQRQHVWMDIYHQNGREREVQLLRGMERRRWGIAAQATLLGIELGRRHVRYHFELGIGEAYVFSTGFSLHL